MKLGVTEVGAGTEDVIVSKHPHKMVTNLQQCLIEELYDKCWNDFVQNFMVMDERWRRLDTVDTLIFSAMRN